MRTDRRQKPAPPAPAFGRRSGETAAECVRRQVRLVHGQVRREQANATPKPAR